MGATGVAGAAAVEVGVVAVTNVCKFHSPRLAQPSLSLSAQHPQVIRQVRQVQGQLETIQRWGRYLQLMLAEAVA